MWNPKSNSSSSGCNGRHDNPTVFNTPTIELVIKSRSLKARLTKFLSESDKIALLHEKPA
jgi:hypothetical protein